ncbi:hypothetical protein ACHAPX_005594 [Trichoderma viride]
MSSGPQGQAGAGGGGGGRPPRGPPKNQKKKGGKKPQPSSAGPVTQGIVGGLAPSSCCRLHDRSHRPPPPGYLFLCGDCCSLDAHGSQPPI